MVSGRLDSQWITIQRGGEVGGADILAVGVSDSSYSVRSVISMVGASRPSIGDTSSKHFGQVVITSSAPFLLAKFKSDVDDRTDPSALCQQIPISKEHRQDAFAIRSGAEADLQSACGRSGGQCTVSSTRILGFFKPDDSARRELFCRWVAAAVFNPVLAQPVLTQTSEKPINSAAFDTAPIQFAPSGSSSAVAQ